MKYLDWNNLIAKQLFNSERAGKEVFLYLNKEEIIRIAKPHFNEEKTEIEIWNDFVGNIVSGLPGSSMHKDILRKAKHCYDEWRVPNRLTIDGIWIEYPLYLAYLVFFVLPLVDVEDGYNTNNYYRRLEDFLVQNRISQNLRNRLGEIDQLWSDLERWANIQSSGSKGYFRLNNFSNPHWVHVGKLFAQCLVPPAAVKRLPQLFYQSGMIPNTYYSPDQIKLVLLKHAQSTLRFNLKVISFINQSETNELGQMIIDLACKEYSKWNGEVEAINEDGSTRLDKKNYTTARLFVQFKLNEIDEEADFSYRLISNTEFPEDLRIGNYDIVEQRSGISKTIDHHFQPALQLSDQFNKWIAKSHDKQVHFFLNGESFQLSSEYWIEVDTLYSTEWMYILCKKDLRERIVEWGSKSCQTFSGEDLLGIPPDYFLFKLRGPSSDTSEIPEITVEEGKSIRLVNGLAVDFRTYTNDFVPEIEVTNCSGDEILYLQYKRDDQRKILAKKDARKWALPDDLILNADFTISSEDELFSTGTTFKIVSSDNSFRLLDEKKLPKRDKFGKITASESGSYSIGSNAVGISLQRQKPYEHLFNSIFEDSRMFLQQNEYQHNLGNVLLAFLTLKSECKTEVFYKAFEFIHSMNYDEEQLHSNFNYAKTKKASLTFFDYLGYLDYEYETQTIVVNPPQLILIPSERGRRVLLIGGRDNALIEKLIISAKHHDLSVEIKPQHDSNKHLLLPDAIIIKSFGSRKENFGLGNIENLASELNIKFDPSNLTQVGLQQFSCGIDDYETEILNKKEIQEAFYDWSKYEFNPSTLSMDKVLVNEISKEFKLVEFRLKPWEFHHRFWLDSKCYEIDLNWGRFLVLKHSNKRVILFDRSKGKLAVPTRLPIPRLLAESIMLLSGIAPVYRTIDGRPYRIYENVPSIFIQNLFSKLKQETIDYQL